MAFPFYKSIDSFIVTELEKRTSNNNVQLSKLVPWIKITSNLGNQYTIGTDSYSSLFDGKSTDAYRNLPGSEWRFRPNPVITDFSVDFASRGTLRRCTVNIKCFSPDQLSIIQEYFLEPGISCFIQWGWNYSLASGKTIGPILPTADNVNLYNRNTKSLLDIRQKNNGCYDNFVGIITGGESTIAGEEFNVQVKLASMGEILFGRTSEGVSKEGEKIEPKTYDPDIMTKYEDGNNPQINFAYFFNQMPEELRTAQTLALESQFKPDSDFINYNESLIEEAKSETTEGWFSGDLTYLGTNFQAVDAESPINGNKYLSFDAFIKLLNQTRVQFSKKGSIDVSIDISNVYVGSFPGIFSNGDEIFIPNKETLNYLKDMAIFDGTSIAGLSTIDTSINGRSFPKKTSTVVSTEDGSITLAADTHGWLGDVYIENNIAMDALKNQTIPVKEILDGILEKMSNAVNGFWDFQIREDGPNNDGKKMLIVDSNLTNIRNGREGGDIKTFNLYGPNSFFLEANFNLDIPKAMASKVFMEKSTATSGITAVDELTTGVFSDKKDNILIRMTPQEKKEALENAAKQLADPKRLWVEFRRNVRILVNPKIVKKGDIGNGNMDEWAICGQYLNKRKFNEIKVKQVYGGNKEVFNGRPLPVEFTFTTLGMSGFQVGHLFRVKGLPQQYSTSKGAFQVEEITHKVDGKLWTTEVKAKYRPFYK